jgi:radical SAM superfamily enzyme YgiQ (UPF0313 family)
VDACRRLCGATILLGGSAVGVMPKEVAEAVRPDYAIHGDGELAVVEFVRAVEAGRDPSSLPGVVSLREGVARVNPQLRVPALDVSTPPRIYRWVDTRAYMKYEGVYPLQSKRGCALKCIYCTYTNTEGKLYRFKSGERMADEIEEIIRHSGVRDFEFVDSTFNVPESHAIDVCEAVIRRRIRANFIGSGLNPLCVSGRLLDTMRRAGFRSLICTAESGSEKMLAALEKGFGRRHIEQAAKLTREAGLRTLWIFLVGGPGETPQTVLETLDFFRGHAGPGDVAFVTNGIRIYPGTTMSRRALAEGVIRSESELIEPRFYMSPAVDRTWLRDTMARHAARDPRLVTSERSQSFLVPVGLRLLAMLGVQKPFWRFAPILNRVMRYVS